MTYLNESTSTKEYNISQYDSVGFPVEVEDCHKSKEHEVHEEGGVYDVPVLYVKMHL
jgi:hypothetical protein